jgi:adenine phosphoribosyltransferase
MSTHAMQDLKRHIRDIPDFPQPGILFHDIMPLLRANFDGAIRALEALLSEDEWRKVDAVAGIESRGFILGSALAARHGKGFVPIRKQGKLPPPVVDLAYSLEYGTGILEMQRGGGALLIVDDVVATGGTLRTAADLCERAGYRVKGLVALIDLKLIPEFTWRELELRTVIRYD